MRAWASLEITAACRSFGDELDVKATTTNDSDGQLYVTGVSAEGGVDPTGGYDVHFDSGPPALDIDNLLPNDGDRTNGTIQYRADGTVVVAQLMISEDPGCDITGMAIGA